MLADWNDKKAELYVRASRFEGFHRSIAEKIQPRLKGSDIAVDIGCGPGLISFEIAPYVKEITGIDADEMAIRWMEKEKDRLGLSNINAVCGDAIGGLDALLPDAFDTAIFCFFCNPDHVFDKVYEKANRFVALITHRFDAHGDAGQADASHHAHAASIAQYLDSRKIAYEKEYMQLDFGQPLTSLEEAEEYLNIYPGPEAAGSEAHSEFVKKRLANIEKRDERLYPYYFPKKRDAAIFFMEK